MKPLQLKPADRPAAEKADAGEGAPPKINILLVDDQPANLLALETLLDDPEYEIVKASTGAEALRCMLQRDFALVLLDVLMPGMDGFETAEMIHRRPQSRHTPIIFITAASSSDTHVGKGYALGAVDYIYKPIVSEILRMKVRVFVDLHKTTYNLARSEAALRRELEQSRKSDEARRESEEKYRKLFESASDAILILDAKGETVLDANKAALSLFGYARAEFLKLKARRLLGDAVATADGRAITREQKRRDGTTFPAEITTASVSLRGKPLLMVWARDITERRRAAEADLLRERAEIQRQMVATVSHELRTPIAAIKASAETLRRGTVADDVSRPRFLKIIANHAERLGAIVEDLLTLAELESGKFKPTPSVVALPKFAEEFVAGMMPLARRKGVSLSVDVQKAAAAWADRAHLTGILQNLIDNAIKYNKKGGSVTVIGRRSADHEIQISIKDTGIGIAAEDIPRLFQQFQRSAEAREMAIKGNGLGLHIVKTMVEANGGRIWPESEKGRGSVFHFTLPAARP